jgi:poly(A) polymerase
LRRDLTVNAMLWRLPRGPLLDLTGGLDDLDAGRLRTVRYVNLVDDPLRVLRAIRLAATRPLLRLTAETERQLTLAAPGLADVARERVLEELRLLLAGPAVERALLAADRCRLLTPLLPSWASVKAGRELAQTAGHLARLARRRGALGAGAVEVAAAVLAAPAAGYPARWDSGKAAGTLTRVGFPARQANRIAEAARCGERLRHALGGDPQEAHAVAAEAGSSLPAALAWALARSDDAESAAALALPLIRWWRRFDTRPPLLSGAQVAALLSLPEGPARADAVRRLRQAQARGQVRTAGQARDYLAR